MSNKPDFVNKVYLHPCKDEVRPSPLPPPRRPFPPPAYLATDRRRHERSLTSSRLSRKPAGGQEAQQEVSGRSRFVEVEPIERAGGGRLAQQGVAEGTALACHRYPTAIGSVLATRGEGRVESSGRPRARARARARTARRARGCAWARSVRGKRALRCRGEVGYEEGRRGTTSSRRPSGRRRRGGGGCSNDRCRAGDGERALGGDEVAVRVAAGAAAGTRARVSDRVEGREMRRGTHKKV